MRVPRVRRSTRASIFQIAGPSSTFAIHRPVTSRGIVAPFRFAIRARSYREATRRFLPRGRAFLFTVLAWLSLLVLNFLHAHRHSLPPSFFLFLFSPSRSSRTVHGALTRCTSTRVDFVCRQSALPLPLCTYDARVHGRLPWSAIRNQHCPRVTFIYSSRFRKIRAG